MAESHSDSPSLTQAEAAKYLGYSPAALHLWRSEGRGPAYVRATRSVRYRRADLEAWQAQHRVETRESRAIPAAVEREAPPRRVSSRKR